MLFTHHQKADHIMCNRDLVAAKASDESGGARKIRRKGIPQPAAGAATWGSDTGIVLDSSAASVPLMPTAVDGFLPRKPLRNGIIYW